MRRFHATLRLAWGLLRRTSAALFGRMSWEAPGWLYWLVVTASRVGRRLAARPGQTAGLAGAIVVLAGGGFWGYTWWQAGPASARARHVHSERARAHGDRERPEAQSPDRHLRTRRRSVPRRARGSDFQRRPLASRAEERCSRASPHEAICASPQTSPGRNRDHRCLPRRCPTVFCHCIFCSFFLSSLVWANDEAMP